MAIVIAALTFWLCLPRVSAAQEAPVFRDPFVLRLHIDSDRYYVEKLDRVPYVAENDVYIFAGESFGITTAITENEISRITYQRDTRKADVEFKFTQESSPNGPMMLLVTRNKLKQKLFFDALMTVPEKKEIYKTTVLPVKPSLSTFESWPHPIVEPVLRNFRFSERPKDQRALQGGLAHSGRCAACPCPSLVRGIGLGPGGEGFTVLRTGSGCDTSTAGRRGAVRFCGLQPLF